MEKKFGWRRLLALLLAVSMVFSSQAFTALAGEVAIIINGGDTEEPPTYDLDSPDCRDWILEGSYISIVNSEGEFKQFLSVGESGEDETVEYPEFEVKNGCATGGKIRWAVPEAYSPVKSGTVFEYKFPPEITLGVGKTFDAIADDGETVIGKGEVMENGLVKITAKFPNEAAKLGHFSGYFEFSGNLNFQEKETGANVPLHFPGLGTRNVTVSEGSSSNSLGFTVGKGLFNVDSVDWGANAFEDAVEYDEDGLIKTIWYLVSVTANEENTDNLTKLIIDDEMQGLEGGGEGDLSRYFHIRAEEAKVLLKRKGEYTAVVDWPVENIKDDDTNKVSFEVDLSTRSLPGESEEEPKGLRPGDEILIKYPVDVDPDFWLKIKSGGASNGAAVELSGAYSARNTITVSNGEGTTQEAKYDWSIQKEWLNKKGTVKMINNKPYIHYEIYVYQTVSESLRNWELADAMSGGDGTYDYNDGKIHIDLYAKNGKTPEGSTTTPVSSDGKWSYKIGDSIGDASVDPGDYILIWYDVLYEEGADPEKDKLRNNISMTIRGTGPKDVGIETSYYSLDKRSLSKAEDVARAAYSGQETELRWETVIGSAKNASSDTAATTGNPVIASDSTFLDVLTCSEGVNHYFTQDDIDGITLWNGETQITSGYEITQVRGYDTTYTEQGKDCHGFLINFTKNVPAPVTVKYTSHGKHLWKVETADYTNESRFTPPTGSMMSDTASLTYTAQDYLMKWPMAVDLKRGFATWLLHLNINDKLEFGFDSSRRYKVTDTMPEDQTFYKAFVVPYRHSSLQFDINDEKEWNKFLVKEEYIENLDRDGRVIEIDVTDYLQEKQEGNLKLFEPEDSIAIYVVTKIDKDILLGGESGGSGSHTLWNTASLSYGGAELSQATTTQSFNQKFLDKNHGEYNKDDKKLKYTVTVNEQGTDLSKLLGRENENAEVKVVDTLEDGLRFASKPDDVIVEVFHDNKWKNLRDLNLRDSVQITITESVLTITYHDQGLPIRFTYDTELTGTGVVHVQNNVEVQVNGEKVVEKKDKDWVATLDISGGMNGDATIQIKKVSDKNSNLGLDNAEFLLSRYMQDEKKEDDEEDTWSWQGAQYFTTKDSGIWNGQGFARNELYRLEEKTAPSGYQKAPDIYFVVEGTNVGSLREEVRAEYNRLMAADISVQSVNPTEGITIKDPQKTGKLTITKTVTGTSAPTGKTYPVTVTGPEGMTFNAGQFSGLPEDTEVTCTGNTAAFQVKAGSSVVINNLPLGVYTVAEASGIGYTATYKVNGTESADGQVEFKDTSDEAVIEGEVEITNTYLENGSLKITKNVIGYTDTSHLPTFYFKVTDSEGKVVKPKDGKEVWSINWSEDSSVDNSVTIPDLPIGRYTVQEVTEEGNPVSEKSPGFPYTVTGQGDVTVETGEEAEITVTNTYTALGSLSAGGEKTVNGETPTLDQIASLQEKVEFRILKRNASGTSLGTYNQAGPNASLQDNGTFSFNNISFTQADIGKEYEYKIEEVRKSGVTDMDGYTVDDTEHTFKVKVDDSEAHDGSLKLTVTDSKGVVVDPVGLSVTININNTYTAEGGVTLKAKKILKGRPLEGGQFTFILHEGETDGTVLQRKTNDSDGTVTFDEIEYSQTDDGRKTYTYYITEESDGAPGYIYSEAVYKVTVVVEGNGDGTLTPTVTYYKVEDGEETAVSEADVEFENTYAASGQLRFTATKQLEGRTLEAGEFTFVLTGDDETHVEAVNDADGNITFEPVKYEKEGTYTYTVTEQKGAESSIAYSDETYTVTVTVTDDGKGGFTYTVDGATEAEGTDSEGSSIYAITPHTVDGCNFINTYTATGELPVGAVRKVLNGAELTAGQFTFTLRDSDTGEVLQTVSNGADGSVTFEPIRYTTEDVGKTYTYEVAESATDAAGITTDTRVYTIRVTDISDNGDGTLKVDYTREYNGEPLEEDDVVTFINTFAGSVTLNKVSTDGTQLPGAVFQLYAQNADGSWGVYTGTNPTGTYTTDINGVVTVPNLPANNYYFVETQAPAGFTADPNARYEFTISPANTSATVGVNVSLTVTNQPEPQEGQLVVTKELTNNGELWAAENATFYVALYSDAALTNRVSDIQAIEFRNASASSVTFTGLTNGQTYYVAEVDAAGNVLNNAGGVTSGEDIFTVNFMNGNEATIVEGEGTRTVFFRNEFMTIPEDYYREGELTVTKSLLGSDGAAKDSDETFYAGIFADAEFTTLSDQVSQNVIPLKMNGKSGAGNTVQVAIAPDAPQTLYVTETDENGKPVDGAVLFRYAVSVENGTVTLDEANTAATVAITNIEDEEKYYREGELTITKRLLGVDGSPKNSSETFYAGIFADANHTTLSDQVSQNIVPLALGGQSSVSALVKVAIMPGDVQTLYVTEVDANGIPVENAASFRYDVTVEGATVTMDEDTVTALVTITNKESTAEEQSETTTTSVKTGDETPIIPFAIAFVVAAAALLIIGFKRRKRKDAE